MHMNLATHQNINHIESLTVLSCARNLMCSIHSRCSHNPLIRFETLSFYVNFVRSVESYNGGLCVQKSFAIRNVPSVRLCVRVCFSVLLTTRNELV